jgi:predicted nicotinamide N-methyase
MRVTLSFESWTDGERQTKTLVDSLDRWEVHAAETVTLTYATSDHANQSIPPLRIIQAPRALANSKIGVGACLWDGAIILGAYLACQPRHTYIGCNAVELGAGVGMLSTLLCKLGARKVYATDLSKVLELLRRNAEANGCAEAMEVMALEWGVDTGWEEKADALKESLSCGGGYPDLVVASDVTYHDNEASVQPDTVEFVKLCRRLCGPKTTVLIGLERRSGAVREGFVREIGRVFSDVRVVDMRKVKGFPKALVVDHIDVWMCR